MERLMKYGWPGNVRELEHVIERAAILSQGPLLQIDESFLNTQISQPTPVGTLEEGWKPFGVRCVPKQGASYEETERGIRCSSDTPADYSQPGAR